MRAATCAAHWPSSPARAPRARSTRPPRAQAVRLALLVNDVHAHVARRPVAELRLHLLRHASPPVVSQPCAPNLRAHRSGSVEVKPGRTRAGSPIYARDAQVACARHNTPCQGGPGNASGRDHRPARLPEQESRLGRGG